ncbi:MAG TPA: ATP-binding cassette domain-containing protein [Gaiellaceae bacterium]
MRREGPAAAATATGQGRGTAEQGPEPTSGRDARRPEAVSFEHASVRLGGRTILHDVSLSIAGGEFVAMLGPNGAGKSTLVKAMLGLLPLAAGRAAILGQPAGEPNARIGYLPQRRNFDSGTRIRGVDLVRLGLEGARWGLPLPGLPSQRRNARRVAEVIELVGAGDYAREPIGQLSGGEQQRLLIAQALVRSPELLLLDEPLDSLDLASQAGVAALVRRICRDEGVAVLLVAHDINPILGFLDRVIYVAGGGAVEGRPQEVITGETLSRLFGAPIEVLRASDGRLVVVGQPEAPFVHGDRHA